MFFMMDYAARVLSSIHMRDGRSMRPDVQTVARRVQADLDFMTGIDMDALSMIDQPGRRLVKNSITTCCRCQAEQEALPKPNRSKQAAVMVIASGEQLRDAAADSPATDSGANEKAEANRASWTQLRGWVKTARTD